VNVNLLLPLHPLALRLTRSQFSAVSNQSSAITF
jgi:hypothetical protein